MAESKTPPISRSTHKPLEYTSCINTTLPSSTPISSCGTINAHSSFDSISQPRDCDTLVNNNNHTRQHRLLERDLHRLDIDSNAHIIERNNRRLVRTESISLPTTPIEQISSTFNHQCHPLLLAQANKPNNTDDLNDKQCFCSISSTDYMIATSEQITDNSMSNSKR